MSMRILRVFAGTALVAFAVGVPWAAVTVVAAQRGMGCCGSMDGRDQMADMPLIHTLLANGDRVTRTVTVRPDGVETLTESDDPDIATAIQTHVESMYKRLTDGRPIHQRDPLFREIFKHASEIDVSHELTPRGVRVVETSRNPYVVQLIQRHAEVLNLFIKNGHAEAMKNHAPPPTP
jgi:hypothetical protein